MGSMFRASCCFLGHMSEAGKTELQKDKARTDDSSRTTLPSTALFIAECTKPATHSWTHPPSEVGGVSKHGPSWTCSWGHGAMGPWGHAHCSTAFYRKAGLQFGRSYSGNKTIFMQSNRSSSGSLGRLASCPEDGQNPPAPTGALPRQCYVEVTTSILEKTIANLIWLRDSNYLINSYNLFNLMPLWPPTSNLHVQGLQSWLLGPCQTRVWRASGIASGGNEMIHPQTVGMEPIKIECIIRNDDIHTHNMIREYANHVQPQTYNLCVQFQFNAQTWIKML